MIRPATRAVDNANVHSAIVFLSKVYVVTAICNFIIYFYSIQLCSVSWINWLAEFDETCQKENKKGQMLQLEPDRGTMADLWQFGH